MYVDMKKRGEKNVVFTNWSKTFSCQPELYFIPESLEELKAILRLAHLENKKIRVIGCGHSPSDLACTTDYLISLKKFKKILHVDGKRQQIQVESGITLTELNCHLRTFGLALSVSGSISDLTIGGAISTGSHGSGIRYGTLSASVISMEILTTTGDIITVSREKDADLYRAACCSLGCFGIILNVTYQCEKAFNLELHQYPCPLKEVLENLEVHLKSSDHFRFLWFPHTQGTVVSHIARTNKKAFKTSKLSQWYSWFWDYAVGYYLLEFCYWLSSFYPALVPVINRSFYYLLYSKPKHHIDHSENIFHFECLFKQYVTEWAIPVEKTALVLYELQTWLAQEANFYAHFPVEVRFCRADDLFISPSYGRNTCYINIIMYRPYNTFISYENYWKAYENIMKENGGRPHWAKDHGVTASEFRILYPFYNRWCQLRKKMDPTDTLVNSYIERIL